MSEIVTIAHNAVTAKLHNPSRDVKIEAQTILSYMVEGAEHTMKFKQRNWDGRSSFFDFRSCTFPAGFVLFLAAALRRKGYQVNTVRRPLPLPQGPERPVVDAFGEDPRYDYQDETIDRLVKHGQIIAQIATGGGKSRVAKKAFARLGMPTLFLTTRSILMYQMKDAFERDLKTKVSVLGDGQFGHTIIEDGIERQAVRKMSVGMVQTLAARLEEMTVDQEVERVIDARLARETKERKLLKDRMERAGKTWKEIDAAVSQLQRAQEAAHIDPTQIMLDARVKVEQHMKERAQTIKLLSMFGLVILEEAHEAAGNSYYEIMRHCTNAHYRIALTATPFMKDSEEANMRLMAVSGPVGIRVTEKMLIDRGILARPYFTIVPLRTKPAKLSRMLSWQAAYRIGIVENEERNNAIVKRCIMFKRFGLTSMVLVQQTAHGETLKKLLAGAGLAVEYIKGEDDQEGRKTALARLAAGEIDVLIGTNILDVGVDVPAVGHVCLAGGGKAEVALRQRIGRGLRAKKHGPNVCFVTDFADTFNVHLSTHAATRLAIIKGTEGFGENVFERGAEPDFVALGVARAVA